MKFAEVLCIGPVSPVGLDVHLPLQSKTIEEVNQRSAHEGLEGLVHIAKRDLLAQYLRGVDFYSHLGHIEQSGGHDSCQLRTFASLSHEKLCVLGKKRRAAARPVLQDKGNPSRGAHSWNRGRWKRKSKSCFDLRECTQQMDLDPVV